MLTKDYCLWGKQYYDQIILYKYLMAHNEKQITKTIMLNLFSQDTNGIKQNKFYCTAIFQLHTS